MSYHHRSDPNYWWHACENWTRFGDPRDACPFSGRELPGRDQPDDDDDDKRVPPPPPPNEPRIPKEVPDVQEEPFPIVPILKKLPEEIPSEVPAEVPAGAPAPFPSPIPYTTPTPIREPAPKEVPKIAAQAPIRYTSGARDGGQYQDAFNQATVPAQAMVDQTVRQINYTGGVSSDHEIQNQRNGQVLSTAALAAAGLAGSAGNSSGSGPFSGPTAGAEVMSDMRAAEALVAQSSARRRESTSRNRARAAAVEEAEDIVKGGEPHVQEDESSVEAGEKKRKAALVAAIAVSTGLAVRAIRYTSGGGGGSMFDVIRPDRPLQRVY